LRIRKSSYKNYNAVPYQLSERKLDFAYLDNQVIRVTYYGKEKIEDILLLLAQKMIFYQERT